jgi:hypothetical protein
MRALGASETDIQAFSKQSPGGIELLRANAISVSAFFAISTCWAQAISPMGKIIRTGLRWADVAARIERIRQYRDLDDTGRDRVWSDLSVMERAALQELSRGA